MESGKELSMKYNYGFALLKVFFSFIVVTCHFYNGKGMFLYLEKFAVPVFIALSFWFVEKSFVSKKQEISFAKVKRFLIPGFFWGVYFVASILLTMGDLKALMVQMLFGSSHLVNPTLWYLYDTALIMCFFRILQKKLACNWKYLLVRIAVMLSCIILEYTEINYSIFSEILLDISYPLGRLIEIIPFACIGSLLCDLFILGERYYENEKPKGTLNLLVCCTLYILSSFIREETPKGFGYQGVKILIRVVLLLLGFAQLEYPERIKNVIIYIQQYCLGIYCVHMAVGKFLEIFANKVQIETGTLFFCFIIWVFCVIGCIAGDFITKRKFRLLIC